MNHKTNPIKKKTIIKSLTAFITLLLQLSSTLQFSRRIKVSLPNIKTNHKQSIHSSMTMASDSNEDKQTSTKIRVISYNVLSSNLGAPDYFTSCNPNNLDPLERRKKVMNKIKNELKKCEDGSSTNKPIFCLQEVSHSWVGNLHTFFANNKYHLVTALYGHKFNGYMGIGIAYPIDEYETAYTNVCRLSDYREDGWPRKPKEDNNAIGLSKLNILRNSIKSMYNIGKGWLGLGIHYLLIKPMQSVRLLPPSPAQEKDHWTIAEYRHNQLIFLSLIDIKTQKRFGIANYHMPCAYLTPMVMTLHADMAIQRVQSLSKDHPFIFAGDFNILPDSSIYHYMTTGDVHKLQNENSYPTSKYGIEFKPNVKSGVCSAYKLKLGKEPDFTNYSKVKDDDTFIGTIDYIFLSNDKDWNVVSVKNLPHRRDMKDVPLPNKKEPSDHILICADLQMK